MVSVGEFYGILPPSLISAGFKGHFSENWGYVSLAPMVGGNLLSLAFGRDFDAHAETEKATTLMTNIRRAGTGASQLCLQGRECYISTLRLTVAACSLALLLSIYAGYKDQKRMKFEQPDASQVLGQDVIWEEEEETA